MRKKISSILLVLCLCLSLFGCSSKEPKQPFDAFREEVEQAFMEGTTAFNMNFFANDPVSLGFEEPTTYGLGFASKEESDKMYEDYKNILNELHTYDYEDLDDLQKRTYDALEDFIQRELALEDYYYYDNPVIGSYSATIHELPLILGMYAFNDKTDLENYFKDIAQLKEDFLNYATFEKERIAQGLGYSQEILDDIKVQIQEIIAQGGTDIIEEVNKNIEVTDFLTGEEKEIYKNKNEQIIKNEFMDAYQALYDALDKLEGLEKTEGLYNKKNGKKYYEAIIYEQLGINESIKEIEKNLEDGFKKELAALQAFVMTHYDLLDIENIYNITYEEFDSPSEGLDYLKTKIFSIVPDISDLSYEIYTVPKSLQESFAPAAYLTARIDMTEEQNECILLNPSASENLLPTLCHEGYPGHMYQHAYFNSLDYPTLNQIIDCIGYTEGWAIYTESKMMDFLENEKEQNWQKMLYLEDRVVSSALALMDIGIHYHGWDFEECMDFMKSMIGGASEEGLKEVYDIIIQTPGYYLYYMYSGQIMRNLYEETKKEMGASFDEKSFHQAILNSGPVGLDVVRKNVHKYIEENKN